MADGGGQVSSPRLGSAFGPLLRQQSAARSSNLPCCLTVYHRDLLALTGSTKHRWAAGMGTRGEERPGLVPRPPTRSAH